MAEKLFEIRWHGRGGQGAVTSANMLAEAAYHAGFKGVMSMPTFGAERRGAPVTASTRLSRQPLRFFSQVEYPDMIVVLDDSLLAASNATNGLADDGFVVVNSTRPPEEMGLSDGYRIATADANQIAEEVGLIVSGALMINTAMLGAIAKATRIITLEHIEAALASVFSKKAAKKNFEAACLAYQRTLCLFTPEDGV